MNDLILLKVMSQQINYSRYIENINLGNCGFEVRTLLEAYGRFFESFPNKSSAQGAEFTTWLLHVYLSKLSDDHKKNFELISENIQKADGAIAESIVQKFQETVSSKKLQELLDKGFSVDSIKDVLEQHEKAIGVISDEEIEGFVDNDLDIILNNSDRSKGFKWRLKVLNQHVGGLSKGDLVVIGAGTDVGKTMFCISESSYMARQLRRGKVLYLNNEQNNYVVMKRIWQSVLGCTEAELAANKEDYKKEYIHRMHGDINRITFIDIQNRTLAYIQKIFKKYKPKLVVIDMADNITMPSNAAEHIVFKNLYSAMRGLAKEYCPVIIASQSDATTTYTDRETQEIKYQLYPHHRQLAGSKSWKPGAADVIIMLGRRNDYPNQRGIHISKNKYGESGVTKEVTFVGSRVIYKD